MSAVASERGRALGRTRRLTFEAILPHVLGLTDDDRGVHNAGGRLADFCKALPQPEARRGIRQLLDVVAALSVTTYRRLPDALDDAERAEFVERLFDPEDRWGPGLLDVVKRVAGPDFPSTRDLARFLKEVCNLAYYSSPASDRVTGFTPLWRQARVLAVAPEEAESEVWTRKRRRRIDHAAIRVRHAEGRGIDGSRLFANDGRPRVAVIGSGCGGAVAAARLAPHADVAIFEAGPRLHPRDFPTDGMAAMALLYDRGVLFPSRDQDLRVLAGRVVGGSSVINEGVTIRPRKTTLDHWLREGAGFDRAAMSAAIDAVEERQRFTEYAEDLLTTPSHVFAKGMASADLMVGLLRTDVATHAHMHAGQPHYQGDVRGSRCLACGYCNHGCRFGHHLSMDRTFLRDAEAAGARVHPNMPVKRLVAKRRGREDVRVTGLKIQGRAEIVEVDHVVLAAGAIGSPALLLRSMGRSPRGLGRIPGAHLVGQRLGFNYGTAVIGQWPDRHPIPGEAGQQVGFVASKPGDETYILENGWITPTIFSTLAPGVGREHREWMTKWDRVGFAVNTIGSPSDGRVDKNGGVSFAVSPHQMDIVWRSLADLVEGYLHAGAERVGLAGVRSVSDRDVFDSRWLGKRRELVARIREVAPTPEHLAFSSGHPQGGLVMNVDPEQGVVGPDFRVHGTDNLFVADASVFPSTITINPQWQVMAMGWLAGDAAAQAIRRRGPRSGPR